MEPYSTDARAGGASPAGTPPGTPGWTGSGNPPSAPGWAGPNNPPAAQGWAGPNNPGTPAWATPNAGVPPPPGVMPFAQAQDSKWPALRLIARILKIIAWVEGGLGVLAALIAGATLSATVGAGGFLITLFSLVWIAIGFLVTYASSEIIMLFISIEKNTRKNE